MIYKNKFWILCKYCPLIIGAIMYLLYFNKSEKYESFLFLDTSLLLFSFFISSTGLILIKFNDFISPNIDIIKIIYYDFIQEMIILTFDIIGAMFSVIYILINTIKIIQ